MGGTPCGVGGYCTLQVSRKPCPPGNYNLTRYIISLNVNNRHAHGKYRNLIYYDPLECYKAL